MLVLWYVGYALSFLDIEELTAERDLKVDHSTITLWVIRYVPHPGILCSPKSDVSGGIINFAEKSSGLIVTAM